MKFSIRLNNDLPVAEYLQLAQVAEEAGFDQFWVSHDLFIRSAMVILTAVASVTEKIEIGTCILNPYTLNPAEIAMFAATLDEYSGGRFIPGISSGAGEFMKWVGIEQKKPRTDLIESIKAIQAILSGEHYPHDGQFINWTDEAYLRFESATQNPDLYRRDESQNVAELSEKSRMEVCPYFSRPNIIAMCCLISKQVQTPPDATMPEIDVAACIWCSVAEDSQSARDALAEKVAYYGHAMSPTIYKGLGLTKEDFNEIERLVMVENDMAAAKKASHRGDAQNWHYRHSRRINYTRIEGLVEMGVNHLSFGPPLGPDRLEAIQEIGKKVIPYFQRMIHDRGISNLTGINCLEYQLLYQIFVN